MIASVSGLTFVDIASILPHKPPFVLVDEVTELVPGRSGRGWKWVREDDWYLQGHFPGNPIVPGVILTECLAQLSAVVYVSEFLDLGLDVCAGKVGYLAKTELKFQAPVRPPSDLMLQTKLARKVGTLFRFDVRASVAGRVVAEGTINVSENQEGNTNAD